MRRCLRVWGSALFATCLLTLGAVGVASADPTPVNCGESDMSIGVQFLGLQSVQNLTLTAQPDGTFATDVKVRAFCVRDNVDIGNVANAEVRVWTSVTNTTANGQNAVFPHGAVISMPDGTAVVRLVSTDPGLADGQWFARVGSQFMIVTTAFGSGVERYGSPFQGGSVFARTPELSSLALFGVGGFGAAGYALTRLRARRGSSNTA